MITEVLESSVCQQITEHRAVKSLPDVPHRLTEVLPLVWHHVQHNETAVRLENSYCFVDDAFRIRHVVQHQKKQRYVYFPVCERQRLQSTGSDVDVFQAVEALRAAVNIALDSSTATTRSTNGAMV